MIAILDYEMGNVRSVANALNWLGTENFLTRDPALLSKAEKIILPGVGAFAEAMNNLKKFSLVEPLKEEILVKKKPVLGICLGMQILASIGFELSNTEGLNFIPGAVRRIKTLPEIKIPHVGWNQVEYKTNHPIFKNIKNNTDFYFVHSYVFEPHITENTLGTTIHGEKLAAVVGRDNIIATQFHPEKSQEAGLKLLENFIHWEGKNA